MIFQCIKSYPSIEEEERILRRNGVSAGHTGNSKASGDINGLMRNVTMN